MTESFTGSRKMLRTKEAVKESTALRMSRPCSFETRGCCHVAGEIKAHDLLSYLGQGTILCCVIGSSLMCDRAGLVQHVRE